MSTAHHTKPWIYAISHTFPVYITGQDLKHVLGADLRHCWEQRDFWWPFSSDSERRAEISSGSIRVYLHYSIIMQVGMSVPNSELCSFKLLSSHCQRSLPSPPVADEVLSTLGL